MIYLVKTFSPSNNNYQDIKEINLLDIEFIDIEEEFLKNLDSKKFDFFLFTSRFGIISAHQSNIDLSSTKALVLNGESRKELQKYSSNFFDIECRNAHCLSEFILNNDIFKNSNIAYFRGKIIANDFKKHLNGYLNIIEFISYKSVNISDITIKQDELDTNSIFIFSSPSLYKRFLEIFQWRCSFRAIALGDTTFNAFQKDIEKYNANGGYESAITLAKYLRTQR